MMKIYKVNKSDFCFVIKDEHILTYTDCWWTCKVNEIDWIPGLHLYYEHINKVLE